MVAGLDRRVGGQLVVATFGQGVLLTGLAMAAGVGWPGLLAGAGYHLVLTVLLGRAAHRRDALPPTARTRGLGPANLVTLARAVLVGGVTALVAEGLAGGAVAPDLLVALATVALVLDGVDGQVARRTGTVSTLGARFDMEVDSFVVFVLSVHVATGLGPLAVVVGSMHYAYVVAGRLLPWLRAPLPTRYSAKVVAVVQAAVLVLAASGRVAPGPALGLLVVVLMLLVWSFGHDVVWLWRRRHGVPGSGRRGVGRARSAALTALAAGLVVGALMLPGRPDELRLSALRLPVEAVVGAAVLLLLPARLGRGLATAAGLLLGVLTVLTLLDLGFWSVLSRPFDPTADWVLAGSVVDLLTGALGRPGAVAALVGFAALAGSLLFAVTLALRRVAVVLAGRPVRARLVVAGLVPVCLASLGLGAAVSPGLPVVSAHAATRAAERGGRLVEGPAEQRAFAAACATDGLRDLDPAQRLAGLRGKDVVIAFVESYGRDALTAPDYAGPMAATLDGATRRLAAAGFGARSGYLTSPTSGGGSWLAHATLLSGVWVDNVRHYADLTAGDRLTMVRAFREAGWRTAAVLPGNNGDWPEGDFYGFDAVYDTRNLGYRGPDLGWSGTPDQYSLAMFERVEHGWPGRGPLFAELALVSSHAPWPMIPPVLGWDQVGDGTVYAATAPEGPPDAIWAQGRTEVRTAYRQSLEYSLLSLVAWLETYGDEDTVLVVVGDHQAAPLLTTPGAGRDVPITIIAGDDAVLDRVGPWGWEPGMRPRPGAPVWPMDAFRDRFVTAFSGGR